MQSSHSCRRQRSGQRCQIARHIVQIRNGRPNNAMNPPAGAPTSRDDLPKGFSAGGALARLHSPAACRSTNVLTARDNCHSSPAVPIGAHPRLNSPIKWWGISAEASGQLSLGLHRRRHRRRASAGCRINECKFGSSSGRRIESTTLPVTAFSPKKSKKFVLARHWFSAQSLTEETLSITYSGKPQRGGISSALLSSFPMVRVSPCRPDR